MAIHECLTKTKGKTLKLKKKNHRLHNSAQNKTSERSGCTDIPWTPRRPNVTRTQHPYQRHLQLSLHEHPIYLADVGGGVVLLENRTSRLPPERADRLGTVLQPRTEAQLGTGRGFVGAQGERGSLAGGEGAVGDRRQRRWWRHQWLRVVL